MRKFTIILAVSFLLTSSMSSFVYAQSSDDAKFWEVQSIDTMKYSRDLAREKINDKSFDKMIGNQIRLIAETGASHITIATPYDKEFLPYLDKWVSLARKNGLKVWFKGNFSGWEGWFDYPKISRQEHLDLTRQFILGNKNLFQNGDVFTACPECENGGPGDPRFNNDVTGHRQFLIDEHKAMASSFNKINRDVIYNYNPMNGDVAFLIMNEKTTQELGGVITIDHYVKTKERLVSDIKKLSSQGGGAKIIIGEIGVPIPDIHGTMSPIDQAKWMQDTFAELAKMPEIEAINYWVGIGGSTQLWDNKLNPRPIVEVIKNFYNPQQITGYVRDELGRPIKDVTVTNEYESAVTKSNGYFSIPYISYLKSKISTDKIEYSPSSLELIAYDGEALEITLHKDSEGFVFKFRKNLRRLTALIYSIF